MKMKMKMTKRLHKYNINRPTSRYGHKYNKCKKCLSMTILIWINQQLSNIWSSIHEKAKQHWGWIKKSIAYKKKGVTRFDYSYIDNLQIAYNPETRFARNKFFRSLTKILEGIKISQNSYSEIQYSKQFLWSHKFLLSKYFKFYELKDFTDLLLLLNFSRTKYLNGHPSFTYLKWKSRVPIERK